MIPKLYGPTNAADGVAWLVVAAAFTWGVAYLIAEILVDRVERRVSVRRPRTVGRRHSRPAPSAHTPPRSAP